MYQQIWINAIAIIALLIIGGGLYGIFYLVVKQIATIGTGVIHFLAIVFILPLLIILGLYDKIDRGTIGTVLGVIVGYVMSGFRKDSA